MSELDFLDARDQSFSSESDFFQYIEEGVDLNNIPENVNLIGSVNNYDNRNDFLQRINEEFEQIWAEGDLWLVAAHTRGGAVPYYMYFDADFPVFITTASITKEMPPTIESFLQSDPRLGRFWLSMEQVERMRRIIVREYSDVIIPFFTGHRSKYSEIPAEKRPDIERTISYWAEDGRETYKEVRAKYGVLPTNIRFERPNDFKFGIKQEGIFTHQKGSITDVWGLLDQERRNKKGIKDVINTGGMGTSESRLFPEHKISASNPWGIVSASNQRLLSSNALDTFTDRLEEDRWKFGVSEYSRVGDPGFDAELVDSIGFSRTQMRGYEDSVRVYPLDRNDIDSQFRIFNFVQDHFDSSCEAIEV